jgi:tetratricopeptide (TPR) repeat protein
MSRRSPLGRGCLPALLILLQACQGGPATSWRDPGTGTHHRCISTRSALAQDAFDDGMVWVYAFHHDEAIRCFEAALAADPDCALAWAGIAYAHGPHINNPAMTPERCARAWEAWREADARKDGVSPVERAWIEALGLRYAAEPPADRGPLDRAYAQAMRQLARTWPDDADVLVLAAEALMDLHPWDLWTLAGEPKNDTLEIVELLERALGLQPAHPGACHFYIHAVEASPAPEKALPAADRLRHLVPAAGHLLHMPAHIDLRLGRYEDAIVANETAMAADAQRQGRYPRAGFYRVYMAHNPHFLAFAAMMQGQSRKALQAAERLVQDMPAEFVRAYPEVADAFLPIIPHVLVRFGRWEEVLRLPPYAPDLVGSNALRHYARASALTALDRLDEAEEELRLLDATRSRLDERTIGNNPARLVLEIASDLAHGEWLLRRGRTGDGISRMRSAAAKEDTLRYDEPPDWMMPVRHPLGAALLVAGRHAEAAKVFEEDLVRFPENGWSLFGLEQALRGLGRSEEADRVRERFELAWRRADVEISSPCFCQAGR